MNSWRALVGEEEIVLPWTGGRTLRLGPRLWTIERGRPLPREFGWGRFRVWGREGNWLRVADADPAILKPVELGYLAGDLFIPDGISMATLVSQKDKPLTVRFERVFLVEPGLEKFTRVSVGRYFEGGPLIFRQQEMPIGPESEVLMAFEDKANTTLQIKGVTPALDAAFEFEVWVRAQIERQRAEAERLRREEEARIALEEQRRQLREKLGDGNARRLLAQQDFETAATAALAVGGAEYLSHRELSRDEFVVRYRFRQRRLECVCDANLRITDAGICLTDHETGEKGDTYFTLESLPSVIKEAIDEGKLVV
jgi:hypothetical protein